MPAPKEHPAVDADIREAASWYDERCPGLGEQFVDAVRHAVRFISQHPRRCAIRFSDIRRLNLRRFPYAVWFFVGEGDAIYVLAVLHHKRDARIALITRRAEV